MSLSCDGTGGLLESVSFGRGRGLLMSAGEPLSSIEESDVKAPAWKVAACLGALYIIWGTTYFAIKVGIQTIPPFFLIGTRLATAGILLLAWQTLRGRRLPTRTEWASAALIGTLLPFAGNSAMAVAEHRISSGATVALMSVLPLVTALWSGIFGRWPRRLEWMAIVVGGMGAAIMLLGRDLRSNLLGALVILLGVTSWSFGSVLSRRVRLPRGPASFGAEMLCAGCIALGVSAALHEPWHVPHAAGAWYAWGYLVVFGSLVGFSSYRYLIEHVSPTLATTYAYVNPPVGLLVGWWLGDESFSPSLLVGLPIVLGSIGLLAWAHAQAVPAPPPGSAALESEVGAAGSE